jgi:hypothetical protein
MAGRAFNDRSRSVTLAMAVNVFHEPVAQAAEISRREGLIEGSELPPRGSE